MSEAQSTIALLRSQLRDSEEIRKRIAKEREDMEIRSQELAIDKMMTGERIEELERREIELVRDLDSARDEKVTLEEKANSITNY